MRGRQLRLDRPFDQPLALSFPAGSMLDALNALVRSRDAEWEIGYDPVRPRIVVSTLAFAGDRTMAPLPLPSDQ